MPGQIYLFKCMFRNKIYRYTNVNYPISIINNYPQYGLATNDLFESVNIKITSSFIQDVGFTDTPITILVDRIKPFSDWTELDIPIEIEVYELNNTIDDGTGNSNPSQTIIENIKPKYKGLVSNIKGSAQFEITISGQKIKFKFNLPILTVSPLCGFVPYGIHCKVNTTDHSAQIQILTTVERFIIYNINNYTTWINRQLFLNTGADDGSSLGLAYENGYIEQQGIFILVEEQRSINYNVTASTTNTTLFNISILDPVIKNQGIEFYSGTTFISYSPIINLDTTTSPGLTIIDSLINNTTFDNINIIYFMSKEYAIFEEYANDEGIGGSAIVVEGDNRSYQHCKNKFNNRERFIGFVNMPDRNPTIVRVTK